jgi:hypothetical protein
MILIQPGNDLGFTHLQHFVLTTKPSRQHLRISPFLFYLTLSRVELINNDA